MKSARSRSIRRALSGLAVGGLLLVGTAVASPALGAGNQKECWGSIWVYGNSSAIGAYTSKTYGAPECLRPMAAYRYRLVAGGPIYVTSYAYGTSIGGQASKPKPSGTIAVGGAHDVEDPAPLLAYQFPFLSTP